MFIAALLFIFVLFSLYLNQFLFVLFVFFVLLYLVRALTPSHAYAALPPGLNPVPPVFHASSRWLVLGFVLLCCVDLEKGHKDAGWEDGMSSSSRSFTQAAEDEEPKASRKVKGTTGDNKVEPLPIDGKDVEQGTGGAQDDGQGEGERMNSIVASPSAQAVELTSVVGGEPAGGGDE